MSHIAVSTILFYKNDVSKKFIQFIVPSLIDYVVSTQDQVTLIITNNAPDNDVSSIVDLANQLNQDKKITIKFLDHRENVGFSKGHNLAFQSTPSDYFLLINNDLFITEPHWLEKMLTPLAEEKVAWVGATNSPRILLSDGRGWWGESADQPSDYLEASLLFGKSLLINKYGLFAPDIHFVYFEDSDLALRYRQLGYQIKSVDIQHEHLRGVSADKVYGNRLHAIQSINQSRFFSRWGNYLKNRKTHHKILLNLYSVGWGDVWNCLPSIFTLLRDHPQATIEIELGQDFLFPFFQINDQIIIRKTNNPLNNEQISRLNQIYDRVFCINNILYGDLTYLADNIAASLGVDPDYRSAESYAGKIIESSSNPLHSSGIKKYAVIHCDVRRDDWEGRCVPPEKFLPVINILKKHGFTTVLVGLPNNQLNYQLLSQAVDRDLSGQLDFLQLAKVIKEANLFIGLDSGPLHLAQTFHIPTLGVFGATNPFSRIKNWRNSTALMNWSLDCLGCYHDIIEPGFNYCIKRHQNCVRQIDEQQIAQALQEFISADFQVPINPRLISLVNAWLAKKIQLRTRAEYLQQNQFFPLKQVDYVANNVFASVLIQSLFYKAQQKLKKIIYKFAKLLKIK